MTVHFELSSVKRENKQLTRETFDESLLSNFIWASLPCATDNNDNNKDNGEFDEVLGDIVDKYGDLGQRRQSILEMFLWILMVIPQLYLVVSAA